METYEPTSPAQAAQALAAAESSRARVAWSGYPAWYWIATGAGLGAMTYAMALPGWWVAAAAIVIGPSLFFITRAACRARGVCEGYFRSAMTRRDTAILYGPAIMLMLGSAVTTKYATWSSVIAAALVCAIFAGTGLVRSACAARR